jgi:hypothetical protein
MDSDNAPEAGFFVRERVDAFMSLKIGGIEQGHAWDFAAAGRNCGKALRRTR